MTTQAPTPVLEAIAVGKSYGANRVLDDVSLTVNSGEVVCIIGPSGAGKSTFLRTLNRLEVPDEGEVWVGGEPMGFELRGDRLHELTERQLSRQRAKTGMVFQHFNLFPHLTVLGNILEGPVRVQKRPAKVVRDEAEEETPAEAPVEAAASAEEPKVVSLDQFRKK